MGHLQHLRHMYVTMGRRCEGMQRFAGNDETHTAMHEQRCYWEDAIADHRVWLARGHDEVRQLLSERSVAEHRCAAVRRESNRLEAAAHQDRQALEQLQRQLQRSNARNAGLEVEARHLGLVGHSQLAGEPLTVGYS